MAISTMRVPTIFTAVDRFSSVVSRMTATTSAFGRTAEAAAMRTSRRFNSAGTSMLYTGAAIATGLGYAVNEAVKFEKAMATVSTTIDNTTPEMMKKMGEDVLAMSKIIPKPISELTEGLYDVVSAGIEASHALTVLKTSGRLGVAGLGTTKEGVDVLTSSINSFSLSAAKSEDIANMVFKAVKYGKTTVSELAESFGSNSALMKNSNVSLEEYLATTAVLTTTGMSASRAQTQVASAVTALIKPSEKMQKVLNALGAKNMPEFIKKNKGLVNTLELVRNKAEQMGIMTSKAFGRKEGFSAMLSLSGPLRDQFNKVFLDIQSGANTLDESFNKMQKSTAANFQRMKNNLTILAIRIGDELLPRVNGFIDRITPMVSGLGNWIKRNEGLATTLMNATLVLLGLGVAAKVCAALFFGLGKVIGIVGGITKAYTFISTLAALSNVGLGKATLSATGAMWKFVSAELAVLAPLGIVALALADLAIAYKLVSDATRKTMYTQVDSYKKSDAAIRYSTAVMKSEFDKQLQLMAEQKNKIAGITNQGTTNVGNIGLQKGGLYNVASPWVGLKGSKTPFSDEYNRGPKGMVEQTLQNYSSFLPNAYGEKPVVQPKNLAGNQDMKYRLPKIGGELTVTVESKDGSKANVDGSKVEGITVKTTKTGGNR